MDSMEYVKNNNPSSETSFFQRIATILAYVIFFNLFLFHARGPVEFGLITLGRFLFLTFIFKSIKNFKKDSSTILSILFALIIFCLGMLLRANIFIQSLLGFVTVTTLHVYAYLLSSGIPMVRSLFELILAPIYFIGSYIKTFFKTIKIIFSGDFKQIGLEKTQSGKNPLAQSLIIGFGIGLFIIGILISMLSSADPIFATFVKGIVSADFLQNLFLRVVLSLLIGFSLLPFIILKRKNIFNSPIGLLQKVNFVQEMSVVMALVSLVIGIFLVVQWPYVFAKVPFETDLSKFGVATYSEYVRKGFTELLKISLFVYGLIWTGLLILRNQSREKNVLKYIQIVVLGEFFVFLFSIFRRVWLYQTYHGWSIVRLYGSFLLLWIFGISIFLALRHFWQKRWVVGEIVFTITVILTLGIFNIESFIVKNHPPTVNKKIDYVYLSRMSPDGYTGWEKAFEYSRQIINKYIDTNLQINRDQRKEIAYAGIVIRELSGNYKDLIKEYGTHAELKQYLLSVFTFQRQQNYKIYVGTEIRNYITNQDNYLEEMKNKIIDGKVDYKKTSDLILITKSEDRYKFNLGNLSTSRSFYDIIQNNNGYYNLVNKKDREIIKDKDSYLDRFFVWNYSKDDAYKNIIKDGRQNELLQLEGKYFELYTKILSQPTNERDFDMDISLDSPLLD